MHPSARGTAQPTPNDVNISTSDQVYALQERVKDLERVLGQQWVPPSTLGLSAFQRRLLGLLVARPGLCTHEAIFAVLYGDRSDPPTPDAQRMQISLLRKRLTASGVEIKTEWGVGYSITPENIERLNALYAPGERA